MIGSGGFAGVWRAYDPLLERYVALKLPRFTADDEKPARRFLNEAKTAAKLRHPNIVAVYESGQVGQRLYIASELVVGHPLSKLISTARPDLRTSVTFVRDLAQALDYAPRRDRASRHQAAQHPGR
jgi:serine/threonine-protein kinase